MSQCEKYGIVNIGLPIFYASLKKQPCKATQLDYHKPYQRDNREDEVLYRITAEGVQGRIRAANEQAVRCIIDSDPAWVDILPAGEIIDGLDDYTIIHSGPPIDYADMVMLHQRGLVSACLFEGWATGEAEAISLIRSGRLKIISALDTNTVGAGTGIITKTVALMVIEDRRTGRRVGTFPAEGPFQGGFCGWGLYSREIAANLHYMRQELFPVLQSCLKQHGPVSIKPILAESMQMGDENHTRQTAAGLLFEHQILPTLMSLDVPMQKKRDVMRYIVDTPRFFHCFGQGASRAALLSAADVPWSTMVSAFCGNGVSFGIKIAGLGEKWYTAPAPMMKGRFTSSQYSEKDQLPWIGDSCVVECAGMGGLAAAASPIVCNLRGMKLRDAQALTREMGKICIGKNTNFPIPNLDFDFLPVGIDALRVLRTGIVPEIHGGMFNHTGGLIGAGSARVPMACFTLAMQAFAAQYDLSSGI